MAELLWRRCGGGGRSHRRRCEPGGHPPAAAYGARCPLAAARFDSTDATFNIFNDDHGLGECPVATSADSNAARAHGDRLCAAGAAYGPRCRLTSTACRFNGSNADFNFNSFHNFHFDSFHDDDIEIVHAIACKCVTHDGRCSDGRHSDDFVLAGRRQGCRGQLHCRQSC